MPLMRRRPLLRAAAVGGGAYMAGKHTARKQEAEYDQEQRLESLEAQSSAPQPAAVAAPAAGGLAPDAISQLQQLGQLHEQGVLTDEEFAAQKARVLGG
jgi:hypothetical protein